MIPSISSTIDSADRLKSSWEHKWVNENRLASLLEYHRYTQDSPQKMENGGPNCLRAGKGAFC